MRHEDDGGTSVLCIANGVAARCPCDSATVRLAGESQKKLNYFVYCNYAIYHTVSYSTDQPSPFRRRHRVIEYRGSKADNSRYILQFQADLGPSFPRNTRPDLILHKF